MIIVTGANGTLGSQIVRHLLERVPAEQLGVSVRDTGRAAELAAAGVTVRAGDFTDPSGLRRAFEGADQVLVVSAAIRGPGALAANNAAIDAARDVGAWRVLYTSHQAASPAARFPPHTVHARTEQHLDRTGLDYIALRNGFYASTLAVNIGDALATGIIAAPADGPVSWTAHADLAQVASILSEITGRRITRVVVDDDEWKATAISRGLSPIVAEFSLAMYLAARAGEYDVSDPTLERILGRRATPARVALERIVSAR